MPFVFLPLVILSLGLAWMLASLGVFLRDLGQTIGLITTEDPFGNRIEFVSPEASS